jgi:hypothetical protein
MSPAGSPAIAGLKAALKKQPAFRHCIELAHAEVYNVNRGSWLQKLREVLAAKEIDKPAGFPRHGTWPARHERPDESGIECRGYDRPSSNGKMRCSSNPGQPDHGPRRHCRNRHAGFVAGCG